MSVKYGKEGKSVPQYDWADPTDYGEEGCRLPLWMQTATQALRDAMPIEEDY